MRFHRSLALGLVLLAASLASQPPPPYREGLLALSGSWRPTPGRLADESLYRPWPGVGGRLGPRQLEILRRLDVDREDLRQTALVELLAGHVSRAIAALELTAREQPAATAVLTDLSAMYLARFAEEGDPLDLLRAYQAAQLGLAQAPGDPGLTFNRAQALSYLGARFTARQAWREVRRLAAVGWRDEAAARLLELRRPTAEEEWTSALPMLEAPGSTPERIAAVIDRLPSNAREHAEEVLLPRFAAAMERGDDAEAARRLAVARQIGEQLLHSRGEALLADAVRAIDATVAGGSAAERSALWRGLGGFGAGAVQYREQNLATAGKLFGQAARDLELAHNPLRFWARFYVTIDQSQGDADGALASLRTLLAEVPQQRYLALTGRCEWIAGTIDKQQKRIQSSVHRYEHAAAALRRAGGEAADFVGVLLAESYTLLGQHSLAWQTRREAFRSVPYSENLRRSIAMWGEAKEGLLRQGSLSLAGPLVEEAVATADRWGRPLGVATAYLERATYRQEAGDRRGALADLDIARGALERMEPGGLEQQMSAIASIREGLCLLGAEPAHAARLIAAGIDGQAAAGNDFEAITYETALAAAQLAAGERPAAEASLEGALANFEQIRSTVQDPVARMQAFRQAQPAFDRLIALRASDAAGDREQPFRLAERARARVLLDLMSDRLAPGAPPPELATLAELERRLPAGTALASYVVLEDRVLAWVVADGRARKLELPLRQAELVAAVERFRLESRRSAGEKVLQRVTAPLYDALVRPLGLDERSRLIVVPDRWLTRLPFAALFDRRSGRYLIEQRPVAVVPSATLLVHEPAAEPPVAPATSVLAAGIATSGSFLGRYMPRLSLAPAEARAVAAAYDHSLLLLDSDASKENFLRLSVSFDVIHFAGHAVVDLESPRRSALLFAARTHDGFEPLTLGELLDSPLRRPRLVVLSACRALDTLAADREGLLGLAGAFYAAGVPQVLASPWDVDDRLSVAVMAAFHREYGRDPRSASAAFRQAVLHLLASRSAEQRSPAAWGGFTVIEGSIDREGS